MQIARTHLWESGGFVYDSGNNKISYKIEGQKK